MITVQRERNKKGQYSRVIIPEINIIPTKEWGYIFGLVLGDGTISQNTVAVISSKTEIINSFIDVARKLDFKPQKYKIKRKNGNKQYSAIIFNKHLFEAFRPCKLEDYHFKIPNFVFKNEEAIIGFLQGFFDAEGSVSIKDRKIVAYSKHYKNLEQIQNLLYLIDIESKINCRHTRECAELGVYKKIELSKFISKINFTLTRKKQKANLILKYPNQPSISQYIQAKEFWKKGYSYGYISYVLNLSKSTIYKWCVEGKIPRNVKYASKF